MSTTVSYCPRCGGIMRAGAGFIHACTVPSYGDAGARMTVALPDPLVRIAAALERIAAPRATCEESEALLRQYDAEIQRLRRLLPEDHEDFLA